MYPEQIDYTEEEWKKLSEKQHMRFFRSNFNFLNTHNGIRPNKMHLLIAPTSSGKSTFVRSMLCDLVFRNKDKKFLIWLTEEENEDFRSEFSSAAPNSEILKNIRVVSELNTSYSDEEILNTIDQAIDLYEIDILIVDNITTSRFYMDKTTSKQSEMAMWYKKLTKKVSVFLIAHTNSDEFNNRFLGVGDIRGSKTITNIAEFLYIMQPINIGDKLYQFINIVKHRGINLIGGRFFRLFFCKETKSFTEDRKVDFETIKELFNERNKLGK